MSNKPTFDMTEIFWGYLKASPDTDQADITEPDENKKANGWVFGEKPPHTYMNWFLSRVGRIVAWLDNFPVRSFKSLANALGTDPAGAPAPGWAPNIEWPEVFKTYVSGDGLGLRGSRKQTASPGGTIKGVATDGRMLYFASTTGNVEGVTTDEMGEQIWLFAHPGTGQWLTVAADGRYVYAGSTYDAIEANIYILDIITGLEVTNVQETANVSHLRADGKFFAYVHDGTYVKVRLVDSPATAPITVGTGLAVNCCELGGELVFEGVTRGAGAYDVRVYKASGGALLNPIVLALTAGVPSVKDMVFDPGRNLLVICGDAITDGASDYSLWVYSVAIQQDATGIIGATISLVWRTLATVTGDDPVAVCMDDKFIYTTTANGDLQCFDINLGHRVWDWQDDGPTEARALRCDGTRVYGAKATSLQSHRSQPQRRMHLRVDETSPHRSPFPNLAAPTR